jgi:hypothetical protein
MDGRAGVAGDRRTVGCGADEGRTGDDTNAAGDVGVIIRDVGGTEASVPASAIQLLVSIYLAGGGVLLTGSCYGRCGQGRIHCSGGRGRDSRLRSGFIYLAVSIYISIRGRGVTYHLPLERR